MSYIAYSNHTTAIPEIYTIATTASLMYTPTTATTITTTDYSFSYPVVDRSPDRPLRTLYTCKYCGTEYHHEHEGFVPNCHNCGARLERNYEF